jgi:SAM-dependent methyltransferase
MGSMKTYHIKEGYVHKAPNQMSGAHASYWNAQRIYASRFHQYQVYELAGDIIAEQGVRSVLDVGCGPGTKLAALHAQHPTVDFHGVDLHEGIDYCRRTYRFGTWHVRDFNTEAQDLGVQADLVICSDVIEHVADPDVLLAFIRCNLAPHGRAILSTPERDVLNGKHSMSAPNRHHVREWNFSEFATYICSAGFRIERHELQFPVRFWPNSIFYREVVKRALLLRSTRYNQVAVVKGS